MGHLDWCQFINADRVSVFLIFLNILILQLDNAPDAPAEQAVILSRVIFVDRDVFQAKVRKLSLIAVFLNVQHNGNFINDCVAPPLAEHRQYFLCLIRTHEVVSKDALDAAHTLLDNFRVVRAAILPQQELQDIDGDVGAFFDFFRQILANNLPIEPLAELALQDSSAIFALCYIWYGATSADMLYTKSEVIRKGKIHKHGVAENL